MHKNLPSDSTALPALGISAMSKRPAGGSVRPRALPDRFTKASDYVARLTVLIDSLATLTASCTRLVRQLALLVGAIGVLMAAVHSDAVVGWVVRVLGG